jgi:hypothetical protein
MTPHCATIVDAYRHFEELHGGDHPVRSLDELRDYVHERGLRYEELGPAFWDELFASGWHLGDEESP